MPYAIIGIGGNIGRPEETVHAVLNELRTFGTNFKSSALYKTEPVSDIPQPWFVNAVCAFETEMSIKELYDALVTLEKRYGKVVKTKDAPRVIDLDLLFYGRETFAAEGLEVPHPRWKERLFVLVPLSEIIDEVIVGENRWNVAELIESKGKELCTKSLLKIS